MNLQFYQEQAMKTYACPEHMSAKLYTSFLLREEVGEFSELFSKAMRDGRAIPYDRLVKELGDMLWSLAAYDYVRGHCWSGMIIFSENVEDDWFDDPIRLPFVGHPLKEGASGMDLLNIDKCLEWILKGELKGWRCIFIGLRISELEVAQTNLAKLADRKSRGVIHGEGDDR